MSLRVSLGNVIRHRSEFIVIDDFETYKRCRVQVNTKGIILRDKVKGIEIKTKRQQVCKSGEFLVAEIDAKMGGFGIVPPELEGAIVSSHYFLYEVDETVLDAKYLGFYIRTSDFLEQVQAQGSTNYAAIRPHDVLEYKIPLPLLEEQRRIVARIEALATKIEEARGLREGAIRMLDLALISALRTMRSDVSAKYPLSNLGTVTQISSGGTPSRSDPTFWNGSIPWIKTGELLDSDIDDAEEYITIEALGKSGAKLFPKNTVLIAMYGQGQTRGRTGRLLIEAATNQACAAILPNPDLIEPRFVQYWLRSLYFEMREQYRDGAQPNWNGKMIKNIKIGLPPISEQQSLIVSMDNLQNDLEQAKKLREDTLKEFDALLPSVLDKVFNCEL
jgi:type I restriction enzyme S subunit